MDQAGTTSSVIGNDTAVCRARSQDMFGAAFGFTGSQAWVMSSVQTSTSRTARGTVVGNEGDAVVEEALEG